MKTKIFCVMIALLALTVSAFSQDLIIKPKKTIYTRKGKDVPKEKRTFTVTYPIVSGKISPAAKKNLDNSISYWKAFETTLAENLSDYDWLYELSYEVKYNKNGILDIALTQEGSGAYPDSQTIEKVIDLKTGMPVKFADVFKADSLAAFAALVNKKLAVEKKEVIESIDKGEFSEDKESNDSVKEQVGALEFTAETFDQFTVSDKGVTIEYDAGFPHVIQAAQPDGIYFFSWSEVKQFIKPNGLLAKFVR